MGREGAWPGEEAGLSVCQSMLGRKVADWSPAHLAPQEEVRQASLWVAPRAPREEPQPRGLLCTTEQGGRAEWEGPLSGPCWKLRRQGGTLERVFLLLRHGGFPPSLPKAGLRAMGARRLFLHL